MNKEVKIYALINPTTNNVFYIGATYTPLKQRLAGHISQGAHTDNRKTREIKSIISAGLLPETLELDTTTVEDASFWEKFYIDLFTSYGFDLLQVKYSTYSNAGMIQRSMEPAKIPVRISFKDISHVYYKIKERAALEQRTFSNMVIYILKQSIK